MTQLDRRIRAAGLSTVLLSAILAVTAWPSARAASLSEMDVRAAVQTWVRLVPAEARPDATVERMEPYEVDGETVGYIAYLAGGGFCICGADERALPVVLYSPHGAYDPEEEVVQYELEGLVSSHDPGLLRLQSTFDTRREYWEDLEAGTIPPREFGTGEGPDVVTLPVMSNWDQQDPYNHYCPLYPGFYSRRCVVGCVATAMSGIMDYWEWPPNSTGGWVQTDYLWWYTNTVQSTFLAIDPGLGGKRTCVGPWIDIPGRMYYDVPTQQLRIVGQWDWAEKNAAREIAKGLPHADSLAYLSALEVLFAALTPDTTVCMAWLGNPIPWNEIQETHTAPFGPEDDAVATLCYSVGVAIGMDYGACGSRAHMSNTVVPYHQNFGYDADVEYRYYPDPAQNPFAENEMVDDIQWMRPVQYTSGIDAHSWFMQGYQRTGVPDSILFYQNKGDLHNEVWYILRENEGREFVRHIAPQSVVRFVGAGSTGDGSPKDPYQNIEAAIAVGAAPDGATLIFKAGSTNTFSASTLTIDRPLTLKGYQVTIDKAK
jgi:hypothetical protein